MIHAVRLGTHTAFKQAARLPSLNTEVDVRNVIPSSKLKNQNVEVNQSFFQMRGVLDKVKNTDLRGGILNTISGKIGNYFPDTCAAEMMNLGYINKELDEDDYPFQPNCNHPSTGENSISCFPGSATVMTSHGPVLMKDLTVGTRVATLSSVKQGKTTIRYEPVLFFLHRDTEAKSSLWITLIYSLLPYSDRLVTGSLRISPYHLVPVVDVAQCGVIEACPHFRYVAAKRVRSGDYLNFLQLECNLENQPKIDGESIVTVRIIGIESSSGSSAQAEGFYAPATESGNLFVDRIMTSQYSTVPQLPSYLDFLAHKFFHTLCFPLLKLASLGSDWFSYSLYIKLSTTIAWFLTYLRLLSECLFKHFTIGLLHGASKSSAESFLV